jgi:hypothetical protein
MIIYDPILEFFIELNLTPGRAWFIFSTFSILLTFASVALFSGRNSSAWKSLIADNTEVIIWPFFIFGLSFALYRYLGDVEGLIRAGISSLPFSFPYSEIITSQSAFPLFMVLSIVISTIMGFRHYKRNQPLWLASSRWTLVLRTLIIYFPMGSIILLSIYRFINYSRNLLLFLESGWRPSSIYHPDFAYGVGWAIEAISTSLFIVALFTLIPLILLIRQSNLKPVNIYTLVSFTAMLMIIFLFLPALTSLDQLLGDTHAHFAEEFAEIWSGNGSFNTFENIELKLLFLKELPDGLPNYTLFVLFSILFLNIFIFSTQIDAIFGTNSKRFLLGIIAFALKIITIGSAIDMVDNLVSYLENKT